MAIPKSVFSSHERASHRINDTEVRIKICCVNSCCKKGSDSIAQTGGKTVVVSDTVNISCRLSSEETQKRKKNVLEVIKSKVREKKELKDGFSFRFDNSDQTISMLTDFIKSERQCCDFFNFTMVVKNDGSLWFDLTGPTVAKEMIVSELGL